MRGDRPSRRGADGRAAGRSEAGVGPYTRSMATENPTGDPVAPPPWREVFRGRRGRLTAGLLLLEALVAVQSLVVATIMPDIRGDLGMVHLYGLAFTAASLATIASIPIVGRAVDRFGTTHGAGAGARGVRRGAARVGHRARDADRAARPVPARRRRRRAVRPLARHGGQDLSRSSAAPRAGAARHDVDPARPDRATGRRRHREHARAGDGRSWRRSPCCSRRGRSSRRCSTSCRGPHRATPASRCAGRCSSWWGRASCSPRSRRSRGGCPSRWPSGSRSACRRCAASRPPARSGRRRAMPPRRRRPSCCRCRSSRWMPSSR